MILAQAKKIGGTLILYLFSNLLVVVLCGFYLQYKYSDYNFKLFQKRKVQVENSIEKVFEINSLKNDISLLGKYLSIILDSNELIKSITIYDNAHNVLLQLVQPQPIYLKPEKYNNNFQKLKSKTYQIKGLNSVQYQVEFDLFEYSTDFYTLAINRPIWISIIIIMLSFVVTAVLFLINSSAVLKRTSLSLEKANRQLEHKNIQLQDAATHDSLTTLPNRPALMSFLESKLIKYSPRNTKLEDFAICFIDFDNFKPVNDRYGHAVGDRVLIEIANRIQKSSGPSDFYSRLGGDEFVIVLNKIKDKKDVAKKIQLIQQNLSKPMKIKNCSIVLKCSIGIWLASEANEFQASKVLNSADAAMYAAKSKGGDNYSFIS
ncbi:MAG: hypothetical protein CMK54_03555 [Proteobacteria bacterium]|nr:hypothetical protein [Pseudomonadota bacterium]